MTVRDDQVTVSRCKVGAADERDTVEESGFPRLRRDRWVGAGIRVTSGGRQAGRANQGQQDAGSKGGTGRTGWDGGMAADETAGSHGETGCKEIRSTSLQEGKVPSGRSTGARNTAPMMSGKTKEGQGQGSKYE